MQKTDRPAAPAPAAGVAVIGPDQAGWIDATFRTVVLPADCVLGDIAIAYEGALNDHVYFSARDATTFGNNGVAFRDTDTHGTDVYAYDLHNGTIIRSPPPQ